MSEQKESLSKHFKSYNPDDPECSNTSRNTSDSQPKNDNKKSEDSDSDININHFLLSEDKKQRHNTTDTTMQTEDLLATFQCDMSNSEATPSTSTSSSVPQTITTATTVPSELITTMPKRKFTVRNYRVRSMNNPDELDSDDSIHEGLQHQHQQRSSVVAGLDDTDNAMHLTTEDSSTSSSSSSNPSPLLPSTSSSSSTSQSYSGDTMQFPWADSLNLNESDTSSVDTTQFSKSELETIKINILQKQKPKYTWTALRGIHCRENGLTGKERQSMRNNIHSNYFAGTVCSSLHAVERFKLMHNLEKHNGCVNCINFHKNGKFLVTGSDDLKLIIWHWATKQPAHIWDSGHTSNVFQAKFLDFIGCGLDVVSSARDGSIQYHGIPESGDGSATSSLQTFSICRHETPVHKLTLVPNNPYEILSASEDGVVARCDFRERKPDRLTTVRTKNRPVPLYSINHHPLDPEFCVCGRDLFVHVYDKRNMKTASKMFCSNVQKKKRPVYITCAVYNHIGTEILASCNDDILLLDNTTQPDEKLLANKSPDEFLHKYSGHRNSSTIKGVNFYGPRSEYIMSGSDCGSIFFWEKKSEAIVQWLHADKSGAVNCLESHPSFPIVATSGLDSDIKIWAPMKGYTNNNNNNNGNINDVAQLEHPFDKIKLEKCVTRNVCQRNETIGDLFDSRILGFYVRQCLRRRVHRDFHTQILLYSSNDDEPSEHSVINNRYPSYRNRGSYRRRDIRRRNLRYRSGNHGNGDVINMTGANDPNSVDQYIGGLPCSPS